MELRAVSRRYPVACHNPAMLVPLACSARVVLYTRSSRARPSDLSAVVAFPPWLTDLRFRVQVQSSPAPAAISTITPSRTIAH